MTRFPHDRLTSLRGAEDLLKSGPQPVATGIVLAGRRQTSTTPAARISKVPVSSRGPKGSPDNSAAEETPTTTSPISKMPRRAGLKRVAGQIVKASIGIIIKLASASQGISPPS